MTGSGSCSRRPSRTSPAAGHRRRAFRQRFVRCTRTRRAQCRKLLEMAVIVLQDYREVKGFKLSLRPARAREQTDPLRQLLFEIETHAPAEMHRADSGDVRRHAGLAGDGCCLAVPPHAPMREKAQQLELPRLSKEGMPFFELLVKLILIEEVRIERLT